MKDSSLEVYLFAACVYLSDCLTVNWLSIRWGDLLDASWQVSLLQEPQSSKQFITAREQTELGQKIDAHRYCTLFFTLCVLLDGMSAKHVRWWLLPAGFGRVNSPPRPLKDANPFFRPTDEVRWKAKFKQCLWPAVFLKGRARMKGGCKRDLNSSPRLIPADTELKTHKSKDVRSHTDPCVPLPGSQSAVCLMESGTMWPSVCLPSGWRYMWTALCWRAWTGRTTAWGSAPTGCSWSEASSRALRLHLK